MKVVEGTDTSSSFPYYLFSVQQQSAHLNLTNGCALVCTFGHLYCSSIFICVFVFWQTTNTQTYTSAAAAGRHFYFLVGYFSLIFPLPPDGQHVLGRLVLLNSSFSRAGEESKKRKEKEESPKGGKIKNEKQHCLYTYVFHWEQNWKLRRQK